jgi:hypothetical protein
MSNMITNYLIALVFSVSTGKITGDSVIKWSENYRLQYSDFMGEDKAAHTNSQVLFDTSAAMHYSIRWKVKLDSGKNRISAFAVFYPKISWMSQKGPFVLKHEQGHFDIAEIYAKKFEQEVNASGISDVKEFISFLAELYKQASDECKKEQDKYDEWTRNTPGQEYYYKWIDEQLKLNGLVRK